MSPIIVNGIVVGAAPSAGENTSASASTQEGESDGSSLARNTSRTTGGSVVATVTNVKGHALAIGDARSQTSSVGAGKSHSVSHKSTLLANIVSDCEWNGQYEEGSPADQREMHRRWLHVLKTAEAFVSVLGHPYAFPIRVEQVDPLWNSPQARWLATEHAKVVVARQWPYTFSPEAAGAAPPPAAIGSPEPPLPPPAGDEVRPDAVVEPPARPEESGFGY